jgi:hypothetical protein
MLKLNESHSRDGAHLGSLYLQYRSWSGRFSTSKS